MTTYTSVPGTPTGVAATPGDRRANVTFTPPAGGGNGSLVVYIATASPGGLSGICKAPPCAVEGLTNGVAYTFMVRAWNSLGGGPPSAPSDPVTPLTGGEGSRALPMRDCMHQPRGACTQLSSIQASSSASAAVGGGGGCGQAVTIQRAFMELMPPTATHHLANTQRFACLLPLLPNLPTACKADRCSLCKPDSSILCAACTSGYALLPNGTCRGQHS